MPAILIVKFIRSGFGKQKQFPRVSSPVSNCRVASLLPDTEKVYASSRIPDATGGPASYSVRVSSTGHAYRLVIEASRADFDVPQHFR